MSESHKKKLSKRVKIKLLKMIVMLLAAALLQFLDEFFKEYTWVLTLQFFIGITCAILALQLLIPTNGADEMDENVPKSGTGN